MAVMHLQWYGMNSQQKPYDEMTCGILSKDGPADFDDQLDQQHNDRGSKKYEDQASKEGMKLKIEWSKELANMISKLIYQTFDKLRKMTNCIEF